jgi:hypothetical protein
VRAADVGLAARACHRSDSLPVKRVSRSVNSWLAPGTTKVAPLSDVAQLTMHLWQFERADRTLRHGKDALEAVRSPK